jgi:hypothetical protein
MGYYINKLADGTALANQDKAGQLVEKVPGTKLASYPVEFQEDLVCVVQNGLFDAAAYVFDEREMNDFNYPDGRSRTWLVVPGAKELSGFSAALEKADPESRVGKLKAAK